MLGEIGAGIGGAVAVGFMFRFLNIKIDTVKKDTQEDLKRGQKKFDKIMDTLTEIQVDNADQFGRINQKLEDLNGKT